MHHAVHGGFVIDVVLFLAGQGIHVCAQRHQARVWILAFHGGHNPGARDPLLERHPPFGQLASHERHGFVFLKRQFRMGMQVPANAHPFCVVRLGKCLDALDEGHGKRSGFN